MTDESLLQAVIDYDGLTGYFHENDAPERKPLRLVCDDARCDGAKLTKFGEPVEVLAADPGGRPALIVNDIAVDGDAAQVSLRYPVEGVRAALILRRSDGDWSVTAGSVVEE